MEKSIVYGLDYYISQMPGAEETDAKSCSPWCWRMSATVSLIW